MFFGKSKAAKAASVAAKKETQSGRAGVKQEPANRTIAAEAAASKEVAEQSSQRSREREPAGRGVTGARRQAFALGQIVSIMMKTKSTSQLTLADLRDLVRPALSTGQYVIAEASARGGAAVIPVAVVLWAKVSDKVDAKLAAGGTLADVEWASGDIPWLVLAAGRKAAIKRIVDDLHDRHLGGKPLKIRKAAPAAVKS